MDETLDALLGGRVRLRQPAKGYRAAIDPVLLAAAVPARAGQRVLDLGIGTGAAALCLAARVPGVHVTGLEMRREHAALAARNAAENGLGADVEVVEGNVADPPAMLGPGSFDHVMANPPHLRAGTDAPPDAARAAAHVEGDADLAAWIACALSMVRRKGSVTVIHRADRIDEIAALLRQGAGEIAIVPLWPRAGAEARRVIVRARKGVRSPARLLPGLALHDAEGRYTPEAETVLREGRALGIPAGGR